MQHIIPLVIIVTVHKTCFFTFLFKKIKLNNLYQSRSVSQANKAGHAHPSLGWVKFKIITRTIEEYLYHQQHLYHMFVDFKRAVVCECEILLCELH